MTRGSLVLRLALLALGCAAALILAPRFGSTTISLARAFDGTIPRETNTDATILFNLRFPRVACAAIAGALLAMAGALTQSVLRNDLATPYTMGISSGAAVGALLAIHVAGTSGSAATAAAALAGAVAAMAFVLALARRLSTFESSTTLVLVGVTLNVLLGSVIMVIQFLADPFQAFQMIRWMMGATDVTDWRPIGFLAATLGALGVVAVGMSRRLDALELGDLSAHALGVAPGRTRMTALAIASFATAMVVAVCGPIGFVGLLVPHAARRLVGRTHAALLPASILGGAGFLVVCDAVARVAGGSIEVPVGIVTALLGGPAFLAILMGAERGRARG